MNRFDAVVGARRGAAERIGGDHGRRAGPTPATRRGVHPTFPFDDLGHVLCRKPSSQATVQDAVDDLAPLYALQVTAETIARPENRYRVFVDAPAASTTTWRSSSAPSTKSDAWSASRSSPTADATPTAFTISA